VQFQSDLKNQMISHPAHKSYFQISNFVNNVNNIKKYNKVYLVHSHFLELDWWFPSPDYFIEVLLVSNNKPTIVRNIIVWICNLSCSICSKYSYLRLENVCATLNFPIYPIDNESIRLIAFSTCTFSFFVLRFHVTFREVKVIII